VIVAGDTLIEVGRVSIAAAGRGLSAPRVEVVAPTPLSF
jgi:hypothetical protein